MDASRPPPAIEIDGNGQRHLALFMRRIHKLECHHARCLFACFVDFSVSRGQRCPPHPDRDYRAYRVTRGTYAVELLVRACLSATDESLFVGGSALTVLLASAVSRR